MIRSRSLELPLHATAGLANYARFSFKKSHCLRQQMSTSFHLCCARPLHAGLVTSSNVLCCTIAAREIAKSSLFQLAKTYFDYYRLSNPSLCTTKQPWDHQQLPGVLFPATCAPCTPWTWQIYISLRILTFFALSEAWSSFGGCIWTVSNGMIARRMPCPRLLAAVRPSRSWNPRTF